MYGHDRRRFCAQYIKRLPCAAVRLSAGYTHCAAAQGEGNLRMERLWVNCLVYTLGREHVFLNLKSNFIHFVPGSYAIYSKNSPTQSEWLGLTSIRCLQEHSL